MLLDEFWKFFIDYMVGVGVVEIFLDLLVLENDSMMLFMGSGM